MKKVNCIILVLILISIVSCSKAKNESTESVSEVQTSSIAKKAKKELSEKDDYKAGGEESSKISEKKDSDITSHFIMPFTMAQKRKLEYSVQLNYESRNVLLSREKLLSIIGQYGFVVSSSTSTYERSPSLNVQFKVKTDSIYTVLTELKKVGRLKRETISVNDLTADNFYSMLQENREKIRIVRRNLAVKNYSLSKEEYSVREQQLGESEDSLDEAKFEQWKIEDRVEWTTIQISVNGPSLPDLIRVPNFRNAFTALINSLLQFVYTLIMLSPFLVVIILIIIKREAIKSLFYKKEKSKKTNINMEKSDD